MEATVVVKIVGHANWRMIFSFLFFQYICSNLWLHYPLLCWFFRVLVVPCHLTFEGISSNIIAEFLRALCLEGCPLLRNKQPGLAAQLSVSAK